MDAMKPHSNDVKLSRLANPFITGGNLPNALPATHETRYSQFPLHRPVRAIAADHAVHLVRALAVVEYILRTSVFFFAVFMRV